MGGDALREVIGRRFRQVRTEEAKHLWGCPATDFVAVARPDADWWKPGEHAYFGEAYRTIAARFPRDPTDPDLSEANVTQREADLVCRIAAAHFGARTPRILDIACGTGRHAVDLTRRGFDVVAMDLQEGCLRIARAQAPIACAAADMRHLPLADGSVDLVVNMWNAFGYFLDEAEEAQVLREFRRVLRPGGLALLHGDLDAEAALGGQWVEHMKVPLGEGAIFLARQVHVAELGGLACLSWVVFPGEEPFQSPAFFMRPRDDATWDRQGRAAGFGDVRIERLPGAVRSEWVVRLLA
jgi:SAM-dependent methyltransferase